MFWDQEDVSDGGFDDGVDIERESAASTPSRPGSAGSFSPFDAAHASADEMLHQLRLDRAARPLGVTSLRRSSSSSCLAATATAVVVGADGNLRRLAADALRAAAEASGLGAAVRVEAAGSAAEASAFLERLRPKCRLVVSVFRRGDDTSSSASLSSSCSSTSSSGSPRPSRDDELRRLSRSLDAAFGVSARVSVEIARDGVEAVRAVHDDVARRDTCFILVLLDLRMPNLDGRPAARAKLRRAGSTAPLVAVTASALPGRTAAPAFDLAEDDAVALARRRHHRSPSRSRTRTRSCTTRAAPP
ncbi:hypothetical protein SO694_00045280 [Aureococcus anophagefferens]|uniref:Response regulatory domain-containing protein n=1 Tax=Aureococcus anophagefferens TaxID=44056 RepID=A0ABR1G7C6_AURAN